MVNSIERLFRGTGAQACCGGLAFRSRRRWVVALRVSFVFALSCVVLPGLAPAQTTAAAPAAPVAAPPPSPLNPAPSEFPQSEPAASAPALDALLSRVAALRSRIAALTSALFSSKLRVELRSAGEDVRLKSLIVSLDGGVVYRAPAQSFFERHEVVYEHAVAPGPHVIGIEVERHHASRPEFSTWQASRFVVVVPEKRVLFTRLELEDESSMAEDFVEDEAGEYDLRIRLQAEVGD
jgi:hypothetical protein